MTKNFTERDFQEMLNDEYEPVEIMGSTYYIGNIIREIDPILFRSAYFDYLDLLERDGLD